MNPTTAGHDLVVIGASAGGVRAVGDVLAQLPEDLPATVCVVIHRGADPAHVLRDVLAARTRLPVHSPLHGDKLQRGHVYISPGDMHLLIRPGYLAVVRGPKENGHRPSVDALFRTAATTYGARVIGVVLTGYLDCGTAGLMSIQARGGITVVQDPNDAEAPEMPLSAVNNVTLDHVVPLSDIAKLIVRLVHEPARTRPARPTREVAAVEGTVPGAHSEIVCPICQGSMTVAQAGDYEAFRCHTGHTFSLDSLAVEQAEQVERSLFSAMRALEESASLERRVAGRSSPEMARHFIERAQAHERDAETLRGVILRADPLSSLDAHAHLAGVEAVAPKAAASVRKRGPRARSGSGR